MKLQRLLPVLAATALVAGCGGAPRHEISISPKFRGMPARTICIMGAAFREKVKRTMPEDLAEMKPERREESAKRITGILASVLGASLTVDSSCTDNEAAREWAEPISKDLTSTRIPLHAEPIQLSVEAVLVFGVHTYGVENLQTQITPTLMKPIRIGKPKLQHWVQLIAVLVNPRNGDILFDIQEGQVEERDEVSQETLDELTRKVSWTILETFFPAKDGAEPAGRTPVQAPEPAEPETRDAEPGTGN